MAWNRPLFTGPADIRSTKALSSSPARWPTAKASAVAVQMACAMKLFSSLMVWPAPGPPTWKMFSAKQVSTGCRHSNTLGSAPTMTLSRPASASTGVRDNGASMKDTPWPAHCSRRRAVESGSLVEQSTIISPGCAPASRPLAPVTQASTWGEPVTQMKTRSLAAATSWALVASVAPAASRSATRSRLRCTASVRLWPLVSRLRAMPWPMRPLAPMNPMRAMVAAPCLFWSGLVWS